MVVSVNNTDTAGMAGALEVSMDAHLTRYAHQVHEFERFSGTDIEGNWKSLLYIATSTQHLWDCIGPHLDYAARKALLDAVEGLNVSERLLLAIAENLYTGQGGVNLAQVAATLTDDELAVMKTALEVSWSSMWINGEYV